jgi:hypothetical protein
MKVCSINGCNKKHKGLGFCYKHYVRFKKNGTAGTAKWTQGSVEERFWRNVNKNTQSDCWEWVGTMQPNGYGRLSLGSQSDGVEGAHRISWRLHNKAEIPKGMHVMHSCDNRKCVNPSHLSVGTPKQNSQDMIAKGRKVIASPVGNDNGKAIINPDIVRQIRQSNESHAALARKFGISPNCVRGVRIGRTWSHVDA